MSRFAKRTQFAPEGIGKQICKTNPIRPSPGIRSLRLATSNLSPSHRLAIRPASLVTPPAYRCVGRRQRQEWV